MAHEALARVNDDRQPMLVAAALHPLNAVPVAGFAVVLMMLGLMLGVLGVLVVDLVAIVACLRWPRARQGLGHHIDRKARQRAAERLGPAEQAEWRSLETLARRTARFNPRRAEVDTLLDGFLDLALALRYARACADGGDTSLLLPRATEPPLRALIEERALASRRAERAIRSLRLKLEATEQLVRLACEVAIAEECEARADVSACAELSSCAPDASAPAAP